MNTGYFLTTRQLGILQELKVFGATKAQLCARQGDLNFLKSSGLIRENKYWNITQTGLEILSEYKLRLGIWELRRSLVYGSEHIDNFESFKEAEKFAIDDIEKHNNVGNIGYMNVVTCVLYYSIHAEDM